MENKVTTTIFIEGTQVSHYSTFTLMQRFNEHHSFELRFNYDQIESYGSLSLDKSKDFVGKNITVEFGNIPGKEQIFIGKITRVEFVHTNGYNGELVISGHSPSILLERGPDLGSYLAKNLQSIVQLATSDAPSNDLNLQIKPVNTDTLDYIIQYRESDFAFLNRLSAEYYEWFFYDGQKLNFGKPDELKEVSMIYGRNLQTMKYGMQVAPLNYTRFAYDPKHDQLLTAQPAGVSGSSPDISFAIQASNQVYSKNYNQPIPVRINSKGEIDNHVNNEQKAVISELVQLSGSSDEPQVALGSILNISTSLRGLTDFEQHDFGKFLVTSVFHQIDDVGHYNNSFEAVAADTERLQVRHVAKPLADMQLATVLDNNDPAQQGRIKLQFKWECTCNDPTEWLRVVSPNAGHGDTGKNRGFLVVPEKGDQVIVGFEEGNIARPIVMGSVYHNNNVDSSGFTDSNIKAMMSRRGSALQFDDAIHALSLGTSAANFINIKNGQALITAQAGNKIVIHTGSSTISLDKDGNIAIVGKNIKINGSQSVDIQSPVITIGNNAPSENATPEQTAAATQIVDVKGKAILLEAEEALYEQSKSVTVYGSESNTIQSDKLVHVTGGALTDISATTVKINS